MSSLRRMVANPDENWMIGYLTFCITLRWMVVIGQVQELEFCYSNRHNFEKFAPGVITIGNVMYYVCLIRLLFADLTRF